MRKKYISVIFLFAVMLMLIVHFGARITAQPTFSFAEEKKIYLTFDDGPSTIVTGHILDTLKEENIKATFFIVSDRAESRKETLRRIAAEGHTLGVHSKTHDYSSIYASKAALKKDITACAERIEAITGVTPRCYRFPGGETKGHPWHALAEDMGYRVVSWNAVCGDEEIAGASPKTLYETSVKTAGGKNPVILLLHDSAPHKATAQALPEIIAHFRKLGYTFCAF